MTAARRNQAEAGARGRSQDKIAKAASSAQRILAEDRAGDRAFPPKHMPLRGIRYAEAILRDDRPDRPLVLQADRDHSLSVAVTYSAICGFLGARAVYLSAVPSLVDQSYVIPRWLEALANTGLAIGILPFAIYFAANVLRKRPQIVADPDGITVKRGFGTTRLRWADLGPPQAGEIGRGPAAHRHILFLSRADDHAAKVYGRPIVDLPANVVLDIDLSGFPFASDGDGVDAVVRSFEARRLAATAHLPSPEIPDAHAFRELVAKRVYKWEMREFRLLIILLPFLVFLFIMLVVLSISVTERRFS